MVSVICLTKSMVYHCVYMYEYIFVSQRVLISNVLLSFKFLSVLFSDLSMCSISYFVTF
jgi:hypothetical protein